MATREEYSCGSDDSSKDVTFRKRKSRQNLKCFTNGQDYRPRLQDVNQDSEYTLTRSCKKDGLSVSDQFDSFPSSVSRTDSRTVGYHENQLGCHSIKVSMPAVSDYESTGNKSYIVRHGLGKGPMTANAPTKKHGMGKVLMSQTVVPHRKHGIGKDLMTLIANRDVRPGTGKGLMTLMAMKPERHGIGKGFMRLLRGKNPCLIDDPGGVDCNRSSVRKRRRLKQASVVRVLSNKELVSRKTTMRNKKQKCDKVFKKLPCKDKCELACVHLKRVENVEKSAVLVDDEELELRELQSGTKILTCSAHFPTSGSRGCFLCKGSLENFPPKSVLVKPPLAMQPWASSPKLVNKLFKAFHFLCTHAITISIHSFTLDDFVKAFNDKNSLLLGQVHHALLRLLLLDIEKELKEGYFLRAAKNCKFLNLLHSLDHCEHILDFWKRSLNHLTWCEIMRQVFIKAGFGSKMGVAHKADSGKEVNFMDKYGLSPGTLKEQLFCILSDKGKCGMGVSDLARSPSIEQLKLTNTAHELEDLILSTLSGDITLFEKIFSSGYRIRSHAVEQETIEYLSDSDEFGSGDDISEVTGGNYIQHDSGGSSPSTVDASSSNFTMSTACNEIDESHAGEVWLLGLSEGEFSDLSIEDKLNCLTSMIDLLSAGSSFRMEDRLTSKMEGTLGIPHGSGAKLKRSSAKNYNSLKIFGGFGGISSSWLDSSTPEQPIDSFIPMSKIGEEEKQAIMNKISLEMEAEVYLHPMQSIFLGSDRRYNRYWLFLGPCDGFDPGHRRIYFESSEDGHWGIIDTREALCALFSALDSRGAREAILLASLQAIKEILIGEMANLSYDLGNKQLSHSDESENISQEDSSSPVSDVHNRSSSSETQNENSSCSVASVGETALRVQQQVYKAVDSKAFDACIWKSFYYELATVKKGKKASLNFLRCDQCHDLYWRDEKHCIICHTTFELDLDLEERYALHSANCQSNFDSNKCRRHKILNAQLQALKASVYAIESAMPENALLGFWRNSAHKLWVSRLRRSSNLKEFLQVLADFVAAINLEFFHLNNLDSQCDFEEVVSNVSTIPHTYSAVALWLVKMDVLAASLGETTVSCHI